MLAPNMARFNIANADADNNVNMALGRFNRLRFAAAVALTARSVSGSNSGLGSVPGSNSNLGPVSGSNWNTNAREFVPGKERDYRAAFITAGDGLHLPWKEGWCLAVDAGRPRKPSKDAPLSPDTIVGPRKPDNPDYAEYFTSSSVLFFEGTASDYMLKTGRFKTSDSAEQHAIEQGLSMLVEAVQEKRLLYGHEVLIVSDSQNALDEIWFWYQDTVDGKKLFQYFKDIGVKLKTYKVAAHAGFVPNEVADLLEVAIPPAVDAYDFHGEIRNAPFRFGRRDSWDPFADGKTLNSKLPHKSSVAIKTEIVKQLNVIRNLDTTKVVNRLRFLGASPSTTSSFDELKKSSNPYRPRTALASAGSSSDLPVGRHSDAMASNSSKARGNFGSAAAVNARVSDTPSGKALAPSHSKTALRSNVRTSTSRSNLHYLTQDLDFAPKLPLKLHGGKTKLVAYNEEILYMKNERKGDNYAYVSDVLSFVCSNTRVAPGDQEHELSICNAASKQENNEDLKYVHRKDVVLEGDLHCNDRKALVVLNRIKEKLESRFRGKVDFEPLDDKVCIFWIETKGSDAGSLSIIGEIMQGILNENPESQLGSMSMSIRGAFEHEDMLFYHINNSVKRWLEAPGTETPLEALRFALEKTGKHVILDDLEESAFYSDTKNKKAITRVMSTLFAASTKSDRMHNYLLYMLTEYPHLSLLNPEGGFGLHPDWSFTRAQAAAKVQIFRESNGLI